MSVDYREGDLFAQPDLRALGHGVNCKGVMGSGIAPLFRARSEEMYRAYRDACFSGRLTLGGMFPWVNPDGTVVYNLASQDRPGRHATLDAVRQSLDAALAHAEMHGVESLGLPRIGAGIGGLRWDDVKAVIEHVATRSPVQVVVVSLPGADR
jgi:O-acetyl-ADP-ribose deacetylase (regulator of RNase III)